jgi:heptosyltransferase-3
MRDGHRIGQFRLRGGGGRGSRLLQTIDRYVGIGLLFLLGLFRRKRAQPADPSTVMLVCVGAVGDLLLSAGSAIEPIRRRFPRARLVLLTSRTNKGLAAMLADCDAIETLPLANPLRALACINKYDADIIIDYAQWPRISAVLIALSNAKFTVGFRTSGQYRHYCYDLVVDHSAAVHEFENFCNLLIAVGVPRPCPPELAPSARAKARIDALGLPPFIVCHPWAAGTKHELREWPRSHWRALAEELAARGYDIVFTGGPSDVETSRALLEELNVAPERVHNFAGALDLDETAALLASAHAVICVNTGIMHIAAALGVPLIALNGPTNPRRWGPLSEKAICLMPDTPDAGYLNLGFEYPRNAQNRMHLIEVGTVLDALTDLEHFSAQPIEIRSSDKTLSARAR